jgi:hypothetical protein
MERREEKKTIKKRTEYVDREKIYILHDHCSVQRMPRGEYKHGLPTIGTRLSCSKFKIHRAEPNQAREGERGMSKAVTTPVLLSGCV